jgi:hypothetical protein
MECIATTGSGTTKAGAVPAPVAPWTLGANLPLALGARFANIAYTGQVQFAYACASRTRESAQRAIERIERCWPNSPLRELTLDVYRGQVASAEHLQEQVLAQARRNCGLAFASVAPAMR